MAEDRTVGTFMTITVLDRTWEIEIWPGRPSEAPNAVYVHVRHKPRHGEASILPAGIRFGITEAEAHRIALALVEAATGNREQAVQTLRSVRAPATDPKPVAKPQMNENDIPKEILFTKTQGR